MAAFRGWRHGHSGGEGCGMGRKPFQQFLMQVGLVLPCPGTHRLVREALQQLLPEPVGGGVIATGLLTLSGQGQCHCGQRVIPPTLTRQGLPLGAHQQSRFASAQRIDGPSIGSPQLHQWCPGSQRRSTCQQQLLACYHGRQAQSGRGEQQKDEAPGSCGHAVAGTGHILRPVEGGRPPVTWDAEGSGRRL